MRVRAIFRLNLEICVDLKFQKKIRQTSVTLIQTIWEPKLINSRVNVHKTLKMLSYTF